MNGVGIQAVAGIAATAVFVTSALPMLLKARQTKDLRSYSPANIALANVGNLLQWIYVSSLPLGPIWLLHGFNSISTALMLLWYLRYAAPCRRIVCLAGNLRATIARRRQAWTMRARSDEPRLPAAPRAALACSC
jgi:hypothetical protein